MKKLILLIAVIMSVNVLSAQDSRVVKECGFSSSTEALFASAGVWCNADEYYYSTTTYQNASGSYCFRVELRCGNGIDAKPKDDKEVKDKPKEKPEKIVAKK